MGLDPPRYLSTWFPLKSTGIWHLKMFADQGTSSSMLLQGHSLHSIPQVYVQFSSQYPTLVHTSNMGGKTIQVLGSELFCQQPQVCLPCHPQSPNPQSDTHRGIPVPRHRFIDFAAGEGHYDQQVWPPPSHGSSPSIEVITSSAALISERLD